MGKTNIDRAQFVLNPFVGCSKCSIGCQSCFAERFAARLAKNPKTAAKYAGVVDDNDHWTGQISKLDLSCFDKLPKKPSCVFVGSMTDFFHENVPYEYQLKVMDKIADYQQHKFLLLTKRIERAQGRYVNWKPYINFIQNVWIGVTVCNQEEADKKIPILLQMPAVKRFISAEPLLSQIDIRKYLKCDNKLDWVIAGGETWPNARPLHPDWVRNLRDQCQETGTPFFFKSWGEWLPISQNESAVGIVNIDNKKEFNKVGKIHSGHLIDGIEYRQFPEV